MADESTRAFVLHRHPWRETSLLVELFDHDHGRVGLIARGARRPHRRGRLRCEPFVELEVAWRGRGELGRLIAAEPLAVPATLPAGPALFSGFYLNELLVRLLRRHDPHPRLYRAYQEALQELANAGSVEPVLRRFERTLLDEIGYGLLLESDAIDRQPIEPHGYYRYEPEQGPVAVADATAPGVVVEGRILLALARGELADPEVLAGCKRLLRAALQRQLGNRPLRSRELFGGGAPRRSNAD